MSAAVPCSWRVPEVDVAEIAMERENMSEPFTHEDQELALKLIQGHPLSAAESARVPGLSDRMRDYLSDRGRSVELAAALALHADLRELMPRAVQALDKLAEADALRTRREHAVQEAEEEALKARARALWGPQGLVFAVATGIAGLLGALASYIATTGAP